MGILIDKVRKTYHRNDYTLVIDAIEDLGLILEIEYTGTNVNPDVGQIVLEIDELMQGVTATPLATGSFEMILRKQNFELYRQGKYLLAKDKEAETAA